MDLGAKVLHHLALVIIPVDTAAVNGVEAFVTTAAEYRDLLLNSLDLKVLLGTFDRLEVLTGLGHHLGNGLVREVHPDKGLLRLLLDGQLCGFDGRGVCWCGHGCSLCSFMRRPSKWFW